MYVPIYAIKKILMTTAKVYFFDPSLACCDGFFGQKNPFVLVGSAVSFDSFQKVHHEDE